MTDIHVFRVLLSLTAIFGLVVVWMWCYRDYRLDLFRQQMFSLRDELFDEAIEGKIDFNHPAYKTLRNTMNGFIRFGHRLGILRFIVTMYFLSKDEYASMRNRSFNSVWEESVSDLSPAMKEKMFEYKIRMNALVIGHVALFSPVSTVAFIMPVSVLVIVQEVYKKMASVLSEQIADIDSAAFALGSKAA